jgi:hypothetical protein
VSAVIVIGVPQDIPETANKAAITMPSEIEKFDLTRLLNGVFY